jgi:hypothetical protein
MFALFFFLLRSRLVWDYLQAYSSTLGHGGEFPQNHTTSRPRHMEHTYSNSDIRQ